MHLWPVWPAGRVAPSGIHDGFWYQRVKIKGQGVDHREAVGEPGVASMGTAGKVFLSKGNNWEEVGVGFVTTPGGGS